MKRIMKKNEKDVLKMISELVLKNPKNLEKLNQKTNDTYEVNN